jgi:hypothetical protein
MADSRTNSTVFDAVAARVFARRPEFVIIGGDIGGTGAYSAWQTEFFRPACLDLISHVPFFLATGNHEGWATNSMAYTRAPVSASNSQDYFSFSDGDVHVLVLDTEVSYAPGSPQYQFAQADLAAARETWRIVGAHKPGYCSGGHGEDSGMKTMSTNIFEPARVDFVIAGLSHFYQHNRINNLDHFVVGTAGAPMYVPTNAAYTLRSVQDYNYAIFDVTPSSLLMKVYNSSDAMLDSIVYVKQVNGIEQEKPEPTGFNLLQNYPNPFNPSTEMSFVLARPALVSLRVYDLLGREVATVVNEQLQAGTHHRGFEASHLASGIYFYRLKTNGQMATRKMALVR